MRFGSRFAGAVFLVLGLVLGSPVSALAVDAACEPLDKKPVKIEAWMSKKHEKDLRDIAREFAEMGNTKVTLWVYPAENPSKILAIGRCVPAYIARHVMRKVLKYTGEINGLVHQGFISSNWMGAATSLFSEHSLQRVEENQVRKLLDESLDTREFQTLYRDLSQQDPMVRAFGLRLPNPKKLSD